ncbi:MAG: DUF4139 domain-containing protein [Thermodesulfobacteriota bacterium]
MTLKNFLKGVFPALIFVILFVSWAEAGGAVKSTARGRVSVDATIYNNNFALIRDIRWVKIPRGTGRLVFSNVPARLIPESIRVNLLGASGGFKILEQSFNYDLITPERLLDKYVGKTIKIEVRNDFNDRRRVVDALLVSNVNGPVYKIGGRIYLDYPGIRILPAIPGGLVTRPTVDWLYKNTKEGLYKLEVNYLTENIGWKADYVLVLNKQDDAGELSGWVTLDNRSGTSFHNARLKLAAGELHRRGARPGPGLYMEKAALSSDGAGFTEKPLFEYYVYDLKRRTTIKDREKKQISFIKGKAVRVKKEFLVRGMTRYFTSPYSRVSPREPVNVYIKFKNPGSAKGSAPLPAGTLRLYKEEADGALAFLGEDGLVHTPPDEEIRLKAGAALQVTAERVQTEFRRVSSVVYETDWEITLRNHKKEDITVGIVEPLSGSWEITTSSHPYKKTDAFTIRFDVAVPKGGEVTVSYRVRVEL